MGFDRREFLKTVGLGSLALAGPGCVIPRGSGSKKPNILFIMVDDLGPEWLGCYGGEGAGTPNVDRLAREGMRFENAYSMPKCTPTRVSLLTGQYPCRTGWVNHWDVPRWGCGCHFDWKHYTSFARVLKQAGYATAVAGKWQINDFRVQPDALEHHGFDDWCVWTGFETGNGVSGKRYFDPYLHTRSGSKTYEGCFGEDLFLEFLVDFMKKHRDSPMLLYYPMCLTHGPYTTTPKEPKVSGKEEAFPAMVRYTDHLLGELLKALEALKIRDNTFVFFTTDNGSPGGITTRMQGREVKGGKGKLLETGCRAPFIVSCPGRVPEGVVTDALTDFTDLYPTFTDLGGASVPGDVVLDGRSMADFLEGKVEDTQREWIMAMGGGVARYTDQGVVPAKRYADRVVRDKRFKLWVEEGKSSRLYDLSVDPEEEHNLIHSLDPVVSAAREKLERVVNSFPGEDNAPRYDPLPPQPWDLKPRTQDGKKGKGRS